MNGQRVNMKSGRGLNVVAWTRKWKQIGFKVYDTYANKNTGFEKDFARLPKGAIIAVAC